MPAITAADVKKLRERTGLPMMDCKKALNETDGNEEAAVDWLRKRGQEVQDKRSDRETAFGRFGLYIGSDKTTGAIVELKCESAPVTQNEEFVQLANDLAEQLATGPGAETGDELLAQPSPSKEGMTLGEQKEDLFNRIREVFNIGRLKRVTGATGGYCHNAGTVAGVMVEVEGGHDEAAKDVAMHVAAMGPAALCKEDIDAELVEKERGLLRDAAVQEGKPENIVDKMVEGRMRNYFAENVLLEQAFVKDDKQSVGDYAKSHGMKVVGYTHWILGEKSCAN